MRKWVGISVIGLGLLCAPGCQRYEARPLVPEAVFQQLETERAPATPAKLSFDQVLKWLDTHSPELKEARAAYQTAQALANVKTPLPNPALQAGPVFTFGPDALVRRWNPMGSLSFTIPTGKRLRRQDELNKLHASNAAEEIKIRQHELVLEVREEYARYLLARAEEEVRAGISKNADDSLSAGKKLMAEGTYSVLDTGLLDVESSKIKAEVLKARQSTLKSEEKLATTLGVRGDTFASLNADPLLAPPVEVPPVEKLKEALLASHPALARLRLKYEVAEAQLRLEISKQYPDFQFGPTFSKDGGDRKTNIGLTLGIDLPIFDRNQQGIASATQSREEARAKYEAEANRALAALEGSAKRLRAAQERYALIHTGLLPKSREHLLNTRKAVGAGNIDQLRVLDAERSVRNAQLEELESEFELRESWITLERAIGVSLWEMEKVEAVASQVIEEHEVEVEQVGLEPAPEPIAPESAEPLEIQVAPESNRITPPVPGE